MKLLKLVYIAHGWYLGIADKPLINEGVQAWKFGPVVPSVYHKFKLWENRPVTQTVQFDIGSWSDNPFDTSIKIDQEELNDDVKVFLNKIWEIYGDFDGLQLSEMTHKIGTPWYKIWHENDGKEEKGVLIPNNVIQEHYKSLAKSA